MKEFTLRRTASLLLLAGTALGSLGPAACAPVGAGEATSPRVPESFTYAPQVGKRFEHTQERTDEVQVVGAPLRDKEHWKIVWDVEVKQESNLYVHSFRLKALSIELNDAPLLKGDEVSSVEATMDILTDRDGNIADIRGTQELTDALRAVAPAERREQVGQVFSADKLKGFYIARVDERVRDFIGRPTKVGSKWLVSSTDAGVTARSITIVGQEPCGSSTCLQLKREHEVDKGVIQAMAARTVAANVQASGGNLEDIQYVHGEASLEDNLLIDPATMEYHGATFRETSSLKAAGPKGQLDVRVTRVRTSSYRY